VRFGFIDRSSQNVAKLNSNLEAAGQQAVADSIVAGDRRRDLDSSGVICVAARPRTSTFTATAGVSRKGSNESRQLASNQHSAKIFTGSREMDPDIGTRSQW
jgi:hypothetical protein